jgi:hypothetical protein
VASKNYKSAVISRVVLGRKKGKCYGNGAVFHPDSDIDVIVQMCILKFLTVDALARNND